MNTATMTEVDSALLARTPEHDLTPSLDRIRALIDVLGEPHKAFPVIHVTGTNGKTSTTRMAEALLREMGLRTGRFTSPHLHTVRERIAIDGAPLDEERFTQLYQEIIPYVELVDARNEIPLSYFEVLVAMAYAAFADAPVDVAIVEVGMGGSWDATNVVDGQVAVITPVAIDHVRFLGSSPAEIASEKAGIIKAGAIAVISSQPPDVTEVLVRRCVDVDATVAREGLEFGIESRSVAVGGQLLALRGLRGAYLEEIFLPLHGTHQAHNAATALAAVEAFVGGQGPLDSDVVRAGFATASSPGRLEVVRRSPTVIVDAAHNPAGARATAAAVTDAFSFNRLVGVVAVFADKDARGILEAFEPVFAELVVTETASARAMQVDDLAAVAVQNLGPDRVEVVPRLDDALDAATRLAEEEGILGGAGVLVTGSIVTVAEARTLLGRS